ncbi:type IV pilus assembly protein PilM [Trichococcus patagoniensis]|uniref:Type IV pilus assembly protein PilM n=1 Tax=Trichococcus patagoniensis TaxID=382641 RepID=A0A2T5IQB4_9LACT|nr:pilus assembly protein PilM [Trichococcus patagoniensis]PTQ86006.1 type IV pilus assembly protein PilM [Trichococcus patagoniensis]
MLFQKKTLLYFEFLERRIRYLVVDAQSYAILEKNDILFDTEILHEGRIINPSLLENRLNALVTERKWKNAQASILLPDDFVIVREEKVPIQLAPSEIRAYIALHMGQLIRSPFKETRFHFELLERDETEHNILLMLYPQEVILQYESVLQKVSLDPVVADISSLCLYRIIQQQNELQQNPEKHVMVLQWSPVDHAIMVFHRDLPKFSRQSRLARLVDLWDVTPEGEWIWKDDQDSFDEAITDTLDVLERLLEFYRYSVMNGEGGVTDIFLTGDFPDLEKVREQLSQRFFLPIHMLQVSEEISSKFLPLYGLALKEKNAAIPKKVAKKKVKRTGKKVQEGK